MKAILGVIAVVIVGYLLWRWYAPGPAQPSAPTPTQRSAPKPTAAARPTQPKRLAAQQGAAKPTPSRPVTPQRRLAPDGTFFLLQRASVPIDSGVIGFAPGTKVTLLEQVDSASTVVTDGQYQFKVQSSQLTNDLDIAASIAKSDYTAQAQLAELTAKWAREYAQQQRDALAASEKEKAQKAQKKTPPHARHP
ncbi:MAG: hypothetical protein E6L07_03605 [Verrucomicrobia bacterium]|nr:MAG: hypothetical protein E6L07_03605 [Verrucomicrobiota bacterium]